jgi:hypothetical protein
MHAKTEDDEFISKDVKPAGEACALVKAGYEYTTEFRDEEIKSSASTSSEKQDVYRRWACGAGSGI